jgi:hypothetical protein
MVVEPQDAIALPRQEPIPTRIPFSVLRLKMLSAIEFNDHPRRMADEIHDVGADRSLASETCSIYSVGAQRAPNYPLRVGGVSPQCFCVHAHV